MYKKIAGIFTLIGAGSGIAFMVLVGAAPGEYVGRPRVEFSIPGATAVNLTLGEMALNYMNAPSIGSVDEFSCRVQLNSQEQKYLKCSGHYRKVYDKAGARAAMSAGIQIIDIGE